MSPRDPPASNGTLSRSESTTSGSNNNNNGTTTDLQATAAMCHHCFDVLVQELKNNPSSTSSRRVGRHQFHYRTAAGRDNGGGSSHNFSGNKKNHSPSSSSIILPEFVQSLPEHTIKCPLFVTWDKKRPTQHHRLLSASVRSSSNHYSGHRHNHSTHPPNSHNNSNIKGSNGSTSSNNEDHTFELRGCIGTLTPKPLVSSIGEYALISALRDKRFDPVTLQELPDLRVAVSLLVQYEECEHCHDWSVGVHGIMIRWLDPTVRASSGGVEYSATYLPEVALEQGWDQQTAVSSLIRKAGYHGRVTKDLLQRVQCTRYQSSKRRLTFEEYVLHRFGNGINNNNGDNDKSNNNDNNSDDSENDDDKDKEEQKQHQQQEGAMALWERHLAATAGDAAVAAALRGDDSATNGLRHLSRSSSPTNCLLL